MPKDQTVYVVSGYMRSGTSMMMQCLEAGGLKAAFDERREKLNEKHGDNLYKPNANGFYELSRDDYLGEGFPEKYQGQLIKCLFGGLCRFIVGKYRVAFMLRDKEEIRQSYIAFFEKDEPERNMVFNKQIANYERNTTEVIAQLRNRLDMEVCVFHYREVLENPLLTFSVLQSQGWPIDPREAAAVVDPQRCRFKIENLEVGI